MKLKFYVAISHLNWDQALDRVLYNNRSSPNATTGDTPFQHFLEGPYELSLLL